MDEFPTALAKALEITLETSTAPTVIVNRQGSPLGNGTFQSYDGSYDAKEQDKIIGRSASLDSDMVNDVDCLSVLPLPEFIFEEPDNTEVISINAATCKKEISHLHGQLPKEYHDTAKRLDEDLYKLMGAISNTMRYIGDDCFNNTAISNTVEYHYYIGRLVHGCEALKEDGQSLIMHDKGSYGLLCKTFQQVAYKLDLADVLGGVKPDTLPHEQRVIKGKRDFEMLAEMRSRIVTMRIDPLHRFAIAEGTNILGGKWGGEESCECSPGKCKRICKR